MHVAPFRREIDERAYLSEINLMLSIKIGYLVAEQMLCPQEKSQSIDELVHQAAQQVLSNPWYFRYKHHMPAAIENAIQNFSSLKFRRLPQKDNSLDVERFDPWLDSVIAETSIKMMRASGWEVFPISPKDFPPMMKPPIDLEKMSCYEYALRKAGVDEAFPISWQPTDLLGLLPKWGFSPVSNANSRPGDLVVFIKDGTPFHMGIRFRNQILAKPGNEQGFAFVHKVEEAFDDYGREVLFYRRNLLV